MYVFPIAWRAMNKKRKPPSRWVAFALPLPFLCGAVVGRWSVPEMPLTAAHVLHADWNGAFYDAATFWPARFDPRAGSRESRGQIISRDGPTAPGPARATRSGRLRGAGIHAKRG
jgi:hypothetical protein